MWRKHKYQWKKGSPALFEKRKKERKKTDKPTADVEPKVEHWCRTSQQNLSDHKDDGLTEIRDTWTQPAQPCEMGAHFQCSECLVRKTQVRWLRSSSDFHWEESEDATNGGLSGMADVDNV